jgi:holo-[acyl-carrier protein] synthase
MILGVGMDLVDIERVERMLERHAERLVERLFTPRESAYCAGMSRPARHYAVRLAAKEAAFKALSGTEEARAIGWLEIEVELDSIGRPSLALHGRAHARAKVLGVARSFVSLSHSDATAGAFVVIEGAPLAEGGMVAGAAPRAR